MKTIETPEDLINFMRSIKMSQIRRQLEWDHKADALIMKAPSNDWVNRFTIIKEFFEAAKEQSV